jgi:hypothetical protein
MIRENHRWTMLLVFVLFTEKIFMSVSSGLLISFEYLLTCDGDELGMLEDAVEAIHALEHVHVRFVAASTRNTHLQPRLFGTRFYYKVVCPLPTNIFGRLPAQLQTGQTIRIVPVIFNVGIDYRPSFTSVLTFVIDPFDA